jgi:hypothetical protein
VFCLPAPQSPRPSEAEYDKKRARLTYDFDEHVGPGEHLLRLSVKDDRGNERVLERKFLR